MTKLALITDSIPYKKGWLVGKEKEELIIDQRDAGQKVVDELDKEIERLTAQLANMPTKEEAWVFLEDYEDEYMRQAAHDCLAKLKAISGQEGG